MIKNEKWKDENSDCGAILEVDIEYPKELWHHHKDLAFLPERKKLSSEKLVTTMEDKKKIRCIHISIKTSTKSHIKIKKDT